MIPDADARRKQRRPGYLLAILLQGKRERKTSQRPDGNDPVAACEGAVRSIRGAFSEPGALERTVRHGIGDMPGSELLVRLVADLVVRSRDLATAIGVDPGLDDQLVELACVFSAPRMQK